MSSPSPPGTLDAALHEAWTLLCDLAVDGITRVDRPTACRSVSQQLRRLGLANIGALLEHLAGLGWSGGRGDRVTAAATTDAWADAAFAVLAGLELAER